MDKKMQSSDVIVLDSSNDSSNIAVFEQCTTSGREDEVQQQQQNQQQKESKNQQKKRERRELYLAGKAERRRYHRERVKMRKRADKASGRTVAASKPPTKLYTVCTSRSEYGDRMPEGRLMNESKCRIRVAVDMAYDELMSEQTVIKTMGQLRNCYAANRRAADPLQFYVVNFDGKAKKVLDGIAGSQQWDIHLIDQPLAKLWDDREIVYLTADSQNVLNELDEQKVYVIGGLLDHNHHKGMCLDRAIAKGYAHAKLPIGDFVQMSTRKVLAINHVFEILLHFTRHNDWERAFLAVIPKRKLPQLAEEGQVEMVELESNSTATFDGTINIEEDGNGVGQHHDGGASTDKTDGNGVGQHHDGGASTDETDGNGVGQHHDGGASTDETDGNGVGQHHDGGASTDETDRQKQGETTVTQIGDDHRSVQ